MKGQQRKTVQQPLKLRREEGGIYNSRRTTREETSTQKAKVLFAISNQQQQKTRILPADCSEGAIQKRKNSCVSREKWKWGRGRGNWWSGDTNRDEMKKGETMLSLMPHKKKKN